MGGSPRRPLRGRIGEGHLGLVRGRQRQSRSRRRRSRTSPICAQSHSRSWASPCSRPNRGQVATAFRNVCDGLIIAGSLLFISWSTALGVVYHIGGGDTLARLVDVAYPVTDIVLCTAALSALSRVPRREAPRARTDGTSGCSRSRSPTAPTRTSRYTNSYGNGNIFDTGYIVGYLLIFLATTCPRAVELRA